MFNLDVQILILYNLQNLRKQLEVSVVLLYISQSIMGQVRWSMQWDSSISVAYPIPFSILYYCTMGQITKSNGTTYICKPAISPIFHCTMGQVSQSNETLSRTTQHYPNVHSNPLYLIEQTSK